MNRKLLLLPLCAATLFAAGELSNRRAPSFSLPDSAGKQYDILDYRGKALVVEVMKTKCDHCSAMAVVLEAVRKQYGDKLALLSLANYPEDNPQSVAFYVNENRVTTPVLFDCGSVALAYMKTTSFDSPHVFLIDARGTIRYDFDWEADTE